MKRWVVQRLIRWLMPAAYFLSAPCLPAVARASPTPSDSVLHCVVLGEARRDDAAVAGKVATELNAGEPGTVRMIYFLPNDRPYRQAVVGTMKATMRRMQRFFGQQMAAHGYGHMTFRYETDAGGDPVVHRMDGDHGDAHYLNETSYHVGKEFLRRFERESRVYFIVVDTSTELLHGRGGRTYLGSAAGGKRWGDAMVAGGFSFTLAAHELAHAFGMVWHDFRDDTYILSYGQNARSRLSACSAAFLSVTPWFNREISHDNDLSRQPTVEFTAPTPWYPAGAHRVTVPVRVADPDGVHQVMLMVGNPRSTSLAPELWGCRSMAGETETVVAFDYDGVIPSISYANPSLSDPATHFFSALATDTRGYRGYLGFSMAQRSPHHLSTLAGQSTETPTSVAFSPDGAILASGSYDGTVTLWGVASWKEIAVLEGHLSAVRSLAFSPDGTVLASDSWNEIKLWEVASEAEIVTMEGHGGLVLDLTFSPVGDILASAWSDSTVRLWDVASGEEIAVLEGHSDWVRNLAFSPTGDILASASHDGTARLWDVASGEEIAVLEEIGAVLYSVAFSPDGAILASGSFDGTVRLWDVAAWQSIAALEAPYRWANKRIAFSPGGGILAAESGFGRVDLWDVVSEELIKTLAHPGAVSGIGFSPGGRVLASTIDTGIQLWDMAPFTSRQSRAPDFDGDGEVGFSDFVKFAANFGFSRGQIGYDPRFDLDRDGNVGFGDFLIFAEAFGTNTSS